MAEANPSFDLPGVLLPDDDGQLTNGITELMMAAYTGDASRVLEIVSTTPSLIHTKNAENGTVLDYAVAGKQIKVVDILLGFGADLDLLNSDGQNVLHRSILTNDVRVVVFCVELSSNINCQNSLGDTALIMAINMGFTDMALYLLKIGCDTNIVNKAGFTARECAFFQNNHEVQSAIMDINQKRVYPDYESGMMLMAKCQQGNISAVQQILSAYGSAIVEFREPSGNQTPLHIACQQKDPSLAHLFYAQGANLHTTSQMDYTPLTVAAISGSKRVVEWLLKNGARLHHRNAMGRTPLHCTTIEGHLDVVKTLVDYGIMLNVRAIHGSTALTIACEMNHSKIVEYLLEKGACINVRDDRLDTPLLIATKSFHIECVQHLLSYHADINLADSQDLNPLMIASCLNNVNLVKAILECGADVNYVNRFGSTALRLAQNSNATEVTDFLLQHTSSSIQSTLVFQSVSVVRVHPNKGNKYQNKLFQMCEIGTGSEMDLQRLVLKGAVINKKDTTGRTPVLISTMNHHSHVVQWLVNQGADVNLTNTSNQTPLMHAVENGDLETVKILISANADMSVRDLKNRDVFQIAEHSNQYHILSFFASCGKSPPHRQSEKAFFEAIELLDHDKCIELLRNGVDVNCLDMFGNTALTHCVLQCISSAVVHMVVLLCEYGIDIDRRSKGGQTALEKCLSTDNITLAKVLLDHGAATDYLEASTSIESCLCHDNSWLKLFVSNALNNKSMLPRFVETTLQFLIANLHNGGMSLLDQLCNDICTIWVDKSFWIKCSDPVIYQVLTSVLSAPPHFEDGCKCIGVQQTLLSTFSKMGAHSALDMLYGEWKRVQPLKDISREWMKLAVEEGNYEVLKSMADVPLLIIEPDVSDKPDKDQILQVQPKDDISTSICCIDQLWRETVESLYRATIMELTRNKHDNIIAISRSWKLEELTIFVHTCLDGPHKVAAVHNRIKAIPHQNTNQIKQVLQKAPVYVFRVLKWHELQGNTQPCWAVSTTSGDHINNLYQTIGCFLRDSKGVTWAVTDASHFRNVTLSKCRAVKMHFESSIRRIKSSDSTEWQNGIIHGKNICIAKECQKEMYSVNIVAIPLGLKCEIPQTLPGLNNAFVFNGPDETLLRREVFKSGICSGYTNGIVIGANISINVLNGPTYHGTFMIAPTQPSLYFAANGDIGAAVVDRESGLLLGMTLASMKSFTDPSTGNEYKNVVFCLRLNHALHLLYHQLDIQLGKFRTL